jgi:hypothetical protein
VTNHNLSMGISSTVRPIATPQRKSLALCDQSQLLNGNLEHRATHHNPSMGTSSTVRPITTPRWESPALRNQSQPLNGKSPAPYDQSQPLNGNLQPPETITTPQWESQALCAQSQPLDMLLRFTQVAHVSAHHLMFHFTRGARVSIRGRCALCSCESSGKGLTTRRTRYMRHLFLMCRDIKVGRWWASFPTAVDIL